MSEHPLLRELQASLLRADGYSGPPPLSVLKKFDKPIRREQLAPLYEEGSHSLLSACCETGDLDLVREALACGLDPNELEYRGAGARTGTLIAAVRGGNPEVVATMLAAGARLDRDRPLIGALNLSEPDAAMEIIDHLLDAGVKPNELHSMFGNMDDAFTAMDFASAQPQEVKDLLRRYGAKTKAELAAEGAPMPREAADSVVARRFEALRGRPARMVGVGDDIRIFGIEPAAGERGITTLFTDGLARTFMKGERFELYMELEVGFDVGADGGWPASWMRNLADLPASGEHFENPVTIIATGRLLRPFERGTPYVAWMLFADEEMKHPAYTNPVRLLRCTPLTKPEYKLERKEGTPALMRALDAANVPRTIAPKRASAV